MPAARTRSGATAGDPVSDFFAGLAEPGGQLATLAGQSASLRFDISDGPQTESWHVTVTEGRVAVARTRSPADAVIQVGRPQFEAMVSGRLNAQAAILRGLLTCAGSIAAFIMFQRCLPGPPGSTGHVPGISAETVMAARRPE
jgi:hypothetical protein